eukprot:TRINITY_DN13998_c0_g1_i1.p1 TRINITY_DN13998_c0_g1~~TRINITY_DN13998_c0_g1_i1.p1  ORF type:complete len:521 (+),score=124.86 TRINITY_DN13998_c0_g1_i1:41-1564(+)
MALAEWLRSVGGYVSESVAVGVKTPAGMRGVVSTAPIAENETLMRVPADVVLDSADPSGTLQNAPLTQPLRLSVLLAAALSDSRMREWVASLPRRCGGVDWWDDCCRAAVTPASVTLAHAQSAGRGLAPDEREGARAVLRARGKDELADACTDDCLKWASSIVATRAFRLPRVGAGPLTMCLVPVADMFNHAEERAATWRRDEGGDVVLYSVRDLPAGAEVTISYGLMPGAAWLREYGFCPRLASAKRERVYRCAALPLSFLCGSAARHSVEGLADSCGTSQSSGRLLTLPVSAWSNDAACLPALVPVLCMTLGAPPGAAETEEGAVAGEGRCVEGTYAVERAAGGMVLNQGGSEWPLERCCGSVPEGLSFSPEWRCEMPLGTLYMAARCGVMQSSFVLSCGEVHHRTAVRLLDSPDALMVQRGLRLLRRWAGKAASAASRCFTHLRSAVSKEGVRRRCCRRRLRFAATALREEAEGVRRLRRQLDAAWADDEGWAWSEGYAARLCF